MPKVCRYSLEMVLAGLTVVSEEGYGVGHHPDVATATVEVRFTPMSVLVDGK